MAKRTNAETMVLHALEHQAKPGDVILQGVRFTDPKNGDVEADFLVLMPDLGVAVLEVKGGRVTYSDGEWTLVGIADPNYVRRIHPVDQARKAKHALRRYLDRQPEWSLGLVRSAWFVVLPETLVDGDYGPEGLRDQLIGEREVSSLRSRLAAVLDRGLITDPRPSADSIEDAVSLLFRSESVSIQHMGRPGRRRPRFGKNPLIAAGALAALLAAGALGAWALGGGPQAEECTPGYTPCVPIATDLNCPDIGFRVQVIGEDVYELDRDGNGVGCESYDPVE